MAIQTATNPQTGETVALVNGQWVPVGQTATNDQGQKAFLVNNQWMTDEVAPVKDAGFSLGDIARSFGMGAAGSTKALTDVAGAENIASAALGRGVESLQRGMTPERQAEMERQAARMKAAEESGSILQEIKAGALNVAEAPLQSAAQAIGSFVPYLPALFAAPAARALQLLPKSVQRIEAIAAAAPKVIGTAQGAGAVKGSIYDGVLQAEIEADVDPEVAKQKADAAQSYFGGNFDQIALGAGLGLAAGSTGVEKFFTQAGRAGAAPGITRRVLGTTAAESLPEAAQGGQERVAQNIALQREGYDVDTFKGVAGAATQEALTGALGAAPIAAMVRPEVKPSEAVDAFKKEEEEFRKQFGQAEPVAPTAETPTEPVSEPVEPPTEFPGGYTATRREISRQDVPESFGIFAEGSDKPLTAVATQEEAEQKLQTLTEIRQQEQSRLAAESEKISADINAEQRKLDVMEATGQTDTDQYVQAQAAYGQKAAEATQKIDEITQRIADYAAPLSLAPIGTRTDVQNEFVVNRGNEPIGVFPTLQEAEATLREREPEVFKQAEVTARTQELEKTLKPMLAKFNLGDVGLNIVEKLENNAGGSYLDSLIRISLEEKEPVQTMRHESLHALKDLEFFTPQQWNALTERANKDWLVQLKKTPYEEGVSRYDAYLDMFTKEGQAKGLQGPELEQYANEALVEEAIADAFGAYDRGATPPPGMIAALFKKLKNFFMNFGQALRGAGFESADDVFQRVERGELKSRKPKVEPARKTEAEPKLEEEEDVKETAEKLSLKTVQDVINDGVDRLVKTARKGRIKEDQDRFAVGNARADTNLTKVQDGIEKRLMELGVSTKRDERGDRELDLVIYNKVLPAYRTKLKEIEGVRFGEEKFSVKGTEADIKKADKYEEENGIRPYVSEGELDLPTKAPKYSLQKFDPKKHLSFDPTLGVPINKDGTVTVYYHTTKQKSLEIGKNKVIPSDGRSRVYLTNESGGDAVLRNKGNFDQEFDGSTVLVYVTPDMLQVDAEYDNGRRDFFIPLAEGDFFNRKMKMQSIQKGRNEAITGEFSYADHEEKMSRAVKAYKDANPAERKRLLAQARRTLKSEHNVGSLLSENGKLEKTRVGEYGLDYEGNSVASQGLGLAAAQKITEKVSTCPRSAICEGLCLGETSGGNFLFGGTGTEDVDDIKKSAFRAGPRMMQYLKTEALIINPEAFATLLQAEIDSLKRWSASPTQIKVDPETKKRLKIDKEIYQPAVRLNVTSDFKPEMFRGIIEGNPDVQFYDYTKLGNEPLSANHHLTYSSTGFGQIINGEKVFFKTKTGEYDHNWASMRKRLDKGQNVAMAFSSKSALPKSLLDEETRTEYRIWDGDDYDARFLDPKQPDGKGMIIGLRNKAGNLSEKTATEKTGGFFVQYNPKTDGDTVFVPPQDQFKGENRKVIRVVKEEKFSLRTPISPAFKQWFGDSKIVDDDGKPKVMYHGLAKDTTDFTRKTERGAPIFLTDDPKFADRFAADSYESVANNPEKYLTAAQIKDGVKRAIAAIRKDYGKDSFGKEMIESLKTDNLKEAMPEAREYIVKELVDLLPTGPHVMALYVRAERPFDYENPNHIRKVLAELGEGAYDAAEIRSGSWESIEGADFQEAIKTAGFDSFYVREHGRKNLAVYQPNQVKSATGNVGTFSRESNDVRYSLKNVAFPSAEEAKKAVAKTSVPKTEEFKRFIAGNQWVDENGEPKAFYHATAREFFEFDPDLRVIYLSDTPEAAEPFGKIAEDRLRQEIYRALTKKEKLDFFQGVVDDAVEAGKLSETEAKDFMRKADRKIPEYGNFGEIDKEVSKALIDLSPTRMAIMPLYARAETPFDFENKEHVAQVMNWVKQNVESKSEFADNKFNALQGSIVQGTPQAIESEGVQRALKRFGFDGYTVRKRGQQKSYAVYTSNQVKSVTGNIGEYSRESKDMRYSLKKVRYSDDRFEKLWNESMYTQNDAENSATGYLAFVHPMEFVRATTSIDYFDRLLQEKEPLDFNRLKAYGDVPFLSVSEKNGEWKITGHEGRHRMMALHDAGYSEVPVHIRLKAENAKSIPVKAVSGQFPNSVSSVLMIAEVEPLSYANKQKAMEKFTRMSSKVKYSLPTIPANINDRIGETTFKRQEQGFVERMISAISPQSASSFRQRYLNRYNQMSVYDKKRAEQMGGAALLADQSAESAALMSDLGAGIAASAMGIGDRNGGIPVLRNGVTTIDTKVKGLIASLAPLAAYGDPAVYQRYQYWAMVKRGQRLNREGKLTGIDTADVAFAKVLEQKHPEFVSVQKDLIAFNNGLVQYMVDTGVLSKERANEYTKHADYIPFYRQMDGDTTMGPNLFQSLSGVKPPKKLKGKDVAEAPLADFLETMVRNTQSAIQAGVKNYAGQRAINVASQVQAPGMGVTRLNTKESGPDIINVLEKGNLVSYRTPDHLLVDAVSSLNLSELPFMGVLSAPADLLRNLVTKDPGFMMANLMRDSLSAWVTSGQKMTPIAGTVINFGKALTRNSPGFEAMQNAGIIGGYEFSANVEQSGFKLEQDLAEKAGKKDPILLRPFTSVWDALEKGTTASDAATRALIYERVLADTGNEAEALYRSLEVMNFHRKGNSALIRVLTAAVPFFNARLQGLDLFYRASTGNMNTKDAAAVQRQFWARGMTMMALSTAYWFMVSDDEEYKKQEQETRDNNWIIPMIGARIPIPFEVGVLFKVIPERIAAYTFGDDTGQDLRDSLFRNAMSTFAFNPIPQTAKPIIEAAFNFNTFTWRPIVSAGMEDVSPEFQVGPSTSNVAKQIGQALGLSPMKVDHIIKGYTGTIGMYGIDTIDMVLDQFGDSPKPTKRFEQLPVIKRFALDKEARGYVTQYYQLKDAVDTTVRTMNLLEKTGESEEYVKYLTENQGTLAFKDYIRDTEKVMKEYREMRLAIRSSQMTGDEKRDALLEISKAESAVTSQIQTIKKAIASVQ